MLACSVGLRHSRERKRASFVMLGLAAKRGMLESSTWHLAMHGHPAPRMVIEAAGTRCTLLRRVLQCRRVRRMPVTRDHGTIIGASAL